MLTVSSGHSVEYLTKAVATGRENYYSRAVADGEPPGRWYGRGAELLGLRGEVDAEVMTEVYAKFADPRDPKFADSETRKDAARLPGRRAYRYADPGEVLKAALEREPDATPERLEELRLEAEKTSRSAVAFLDVTFSVQKSVTVLHTAFEAQEVAARRAGETEKAAAWAAQRNAVEEAIRAGNRAALEYLAEHAGYARVGYHRSGATGRFVDAHDWTVASFFQHTSRSNDPQLHIHNAILNRVPCPDGKWRTLDSRAIHRNRGAAGALAERTMEEHLTRTLGVRFATRPDGKAREVVGIRSEVLDLFSARRRAITKRTRELTAEFVQRYGREPNALELDRLSRQATFVTRPGKSHTGETVGQRLDRWSAQLRDEIDSSLAEVAHDALGHAGEAVAERFSPRAVIETALADVQERKAAWHRGDLLRAVTAALPERLGGMEPTDLRALVESLTDQALQAHRLESLTSDVDAPVPPEFTLADGRSAYQAPAGRLYATAGQVAAERALRDAAVRRGRVAVPAEVAGGVLARYTEATGVELGADQAAAVRGVLTSGAAVEVLVGPAGTGKSRTVGALAAAWTAPETWPDRAHPPRVVGLAASQLAAEVLAGEGLTARNIARWLAAQERLTNGRAGREDEPWRLAAGDLVVVDEAAMADTAAVAEIHRHVERAGAKLLLTGDHRQLAAVGAGGAFDLVAREAARYELAEVRRFAAGWERDASLRLREGDLSAVREYARHGRLVDAGTSEQAGQAARLAWLADTLAGRRSLLLVDSNEQAATAAAEARADLVRLGRVDDTVTVPLERDGNRAGAGDLVQARKLAPQLRGWEGNPAGPVNREFYRVTCVRDDGALTLAPVVGRDEQGERLGEALTLPPGYVREHLTLGYAATVHSAQGLTVDTSHTVITPGSSAAGAYVGLTRGRQENTAYVATVAAAPDAPSGEAKDADRRSPAAVLAEVIERDEPETAALITAELSQAEAGSLVTIRQRIADAGEQLAQRRHAALFDRLAERGLMSGQHREALAADPANSALSQLLRTAELAGHDLERELTAALAGRPLDGSRSVAQVLHHRLSDQLAGQLTPAGDTFADRMPPPPSPAWATYLDRLAELADDRRHALGVQVAAEAPQWAVEALGPVPGDPAERREWEHRAGVVAAQRELTGWDDPAQPIGPAPRPGAVDARAAWHAAWRALGRPEASAEEAELADGALRLRVRAYQREETWAPAWVGDQLATTAQAAARWRQTATLAAAEADAAADPETREAEQRRADQATAMADTLAEQHRRLELADQARGQWYAHTAATREAAHRARAELTRRGVAVDDPDDAVTAEQWLAAQAEAQQAEDAHRPAGPGDLVDEHAARQADLAATFTDQPHTAAAGEQTAGEPVTASEVDTATAAGDAAAPDPIATTEPVASKADTTGAASGTTAADQPTEPAATPAPMPERQPTTAGEQLATRATAGTAGKPTTSATGALASGSARSTAGSLPPGVPTLAETAAQVLRAQAALTRLADRRDLETRRQADEAEELAAAELAARQRGQEQQTSTRIADDDAVLTHG